MAAAAMGEEAAAAAAACRGEEYGERQTCCTYRYHCIEIKAQAHLYPWDGMHQATSASLITGQR